MDKFLPSQESRLFVSEGDLHVINLGYNDFSKPDLTPILAPRLQGYYTLHFVLSGKGTLVFGGNTYTITANSLFFLPPDQPILYYPDPDDPWEYVWFAISGSKAAPLGTLMGFSENKPVISIPFPQPIRLCLERLFVSLGNADDYYLVLSAFYEIVHRCHQDIQPRSMESVKELIDANFTSNSFSVEKLCKAVYISHSHLCRLFKATYGISVKHYLISKRLSHAKHLLKTSNLSVKTIAFSCGFNDELHFMKTFKSQTGVTALAYRNATP